MEDEACMKVRYSHGEGDFSFVEKDYVTVVVRYLYIEDPDQELYYQGTITKVEEDGFWCILDNEQEQEEYFSFLDIEDVWPGDMIPFFIPNN